VTVTFMRTTTIDCDKCGKRIEAALAVVRLDGLGSLKGFAADLCGPCAESLRGWLQGGERVERAVPEETMGAQP
jgi:hypothetical protein